MRDKSKRSKRINLSSAEKHNKPINVVCVIYGKSTSTYHVPKQIKIRCVLDDKDKFVCLKCSKKEDHIIEVIPKDEMILRFIDIHSDKMQKVIENVGRLKCKFSYEILSYQDVVRIFVMLPADNDRKKLTGLATVSYFVGNQLDENCKYRMTGYVTVNPVDQTVTHVFTEAIKEKSDADTFILDADMHKQLSVFSRDFDSAEDIMGYLEDLYDSYANNITKIVGRVDLHMAVDLVFRSPMSFRLGNEHVPRGWADIMILGDSSCGKNYVVNRLMEYYRIGEMIGAENATFAGLIGGLQQLGNRNWTITWGKIPLNDGGLLCIDEASELKHTDWTRLSRIRSEGIAEVTKINTQSTSARTRLIFLANPIEKTIANYSHGIQAVQDLVKQPEDVRRFDYVLIVAHADVSVDEIHDKIRSNKMSESFYTPEAEQNLILWAWSRKIDDIKFSGEALEYIYEKSPQFAKRYTFSIPLVQGENVRIKIAKLAIEFAARMYSNLNEGRTLHVKKIHVDCALIFLSMIYDKSSSGYSALSKLNAKVEAPYKSERFLSVSKYLDSYMDKKETLEYLLKYDTITFKSLHEYTGRDPTVTQELLSHLLQFDLLIPASERSTQRYHKTPSFTEYVKIALKHLNRNRTAPLLAKFEELADTEEKEQEERMLKKKKEKQKHKHKHNDNNKGGDNGKQT
jgi:hypothetical protein